MSFACLNAGVVVALSITTAHCTSPMHVPQNTKKKSEGEQLPNIWHQLVQ